MLLKVWLHSDSLTHFHSMSLNFFCFLKASLRKNNKHQAAPNQQDTPIFYMIPILPITAVLCVTMIPGKPSHAKNSMRPHTGRPDCLECSESPECVSCENWQHGGRDTTSPEPGGTRSLSPGKSFISGSMSMAGNKDKTCIHLPKPGLLSPSQEGIQMTKFTFLWA